MKISHLLLTIAIAAACSVIAYQSALVRQQMKFVPAEISRVVMSDSDEPIVSDHGQIPRPYSVLVYQPAPRTLVLPGVAGEAGRIVLINPDWLK